MGIDTHLAMTDFKVAITEEAKAALAKEVLRSQRKRAPEDILDIMGKRRPIGCAKYKDTGRIAWVKRLKPLEGQVFCQSTGSADGRDVPIEVLEARRQAPASRMSLSKDDLVFFCGHCGLDAHASRKAFSKEDLGKKTRCSQCNKTHIAGSWKCKCGLLWYLCKHHGDMPKEIREQAKKKKEAVHRGKKEKRNAEPPKERSRNVHFTREERRKVESRGLRKCFLSASLKRKFEHLCTD